MRRAALSPLSTETSQPSRRSCFDTSAAAWASLSSLAFPATTHASSSSERAAAISSAWAAEAPWNSKKQSISASMRS